MGYPFEDEERVVIWMNPFQKDGQISRNDNAVFDVTNFQDFLTFNSYGHSSSPDSSGQWGLSVMPTTHLQLVLGPENMDIYILFNFGGLHSVVSVTMTCFGCAVNRNKFFISYSPFHITTCFGPYRTSSDENIQVVFKAITPTTVPVLGYTVHYFTLCYVIYYN
jgi:hypothetical protein